jgi:hypothetical protein
MNFSFSLDGYHGASGTWTILVPEPSAGNLPERVYGLRLQVEGAGYPIGHIRARHLGSPACEYDVESLAILTAREKKHLERQARRFVQQESDAFAIVNAATGAFSP